MCSSDLFSLFRAVYQHRFFFIQNSTVYQRLKHQGLAEKDILKILNEKKAMLVYSPEEGEMRVDYSSIDSIKHYLKILHPAMIAVEPQSGKVKAWVGDLNYKYFQYDQVEAPRQVGSVFKPVVYSAAIHQGTRLKQYFDSDGIDRFTKGSFQGVISLVIVVLL